MLPPDLSAGFPDDQPDLQESKETRRLPFAFLSVSRSPICCSPITVHIFTRYQKCNEAKSYTGCCTLDDFLQKRLQYILLIGGEKIQHLLV